MSDLESQGVETDNTQLNDITIYVELLKDFAETNDKYKDGANVFSYAKTLDGRHVVPVNALNEFKELFLSVDVTTLRLVRLSTTDFPKIVKEVLDLSSK